MAFCTNCGSKLVEDARFCDKCGTAVEAPVAAPAPEAPAAPEMPVYEAPAAPEMPVYQAPEAPVYEAPAAQPVYAEPVVQPTYAVPVQPEESSGRNVKGLVFSIVAMATGIFGLVFCWYPVLGTIFSIVGIVFGALSKNTGKPAMARAGIICGAIGAGLNFIFTIIILAMGIGGEIFNMMDYNYYY